MGTYVNTHSTFVFFHYQVCVDSTLNLVGSTIFFSFFHSRLDIPGHLHRLPNILAIKILVTKEHRTFTITTQSVSIIISLSH